MRADVEARRRRRSAKRYRLYEGPVYGGLSARAGGDPVRRPAPIASAGSGPRALRGTSGPREREAPAGCPRRVRTSPSFSFHHFAHSSRLVRRSFFVSPTTQRWSWPRDRGERLGRRLRTRSSLSSSASRSGGHGVAGRELAERRGRAQAHVVVLVDLERLDEGRRRARGPSGRCSSYVALNAMPLSGSRSLRIAFSKASWWRLTPFGIDDDGRRSGPRGRRAGRIRRSRRRARPASTGPAPAGPPASMPASGGVGAAPERAARSRTSSSIRAARPIFSSRPSMRRDCSVA